MTIFVPRCENKSRACGSAVYMAMGCRLVCILFVVIFGLLELALPRWGARAYGCTEQWCVSYGHSESMNTKRKDVSYGNT